MNRIESRLDNEENNFRSEEGNRYIAYEKYEPKILVKRNVDTGDWHFIAVSKDNIELLKLLLIIDKIESYEYSSL